MITEAFLLQRYSGSSMLKTVRYEIANACNAFVKSGLADANFTKELYLGSEPKFWSRVSEALLAEHLRNVGLDPASSKGGGPDFLLIENGR